jgi:hypothetical protein
MAALLVGGRNTGRYLRVVGRLVCRIRLVPANHLAGWLSAVR